MIGETYRHGDVVVERIADDVRTGDEVRRDARGHVVLAEGEATGHAHRIVAKSARLFADPENDNAKILVVARTVGLSHEEHHTIKLPPGKYRVRVKRQYNPEGSWSLVVD